MIQQKTIYAMSELKTVHDVESSPSFSRYRFHADDPAFLIRSGVEAPIPSLPDEEGDVITSIPRGDSWSYLAYLNGGWKPSPACQALHDRGAFE